MTTISVTHSRAIGLVRLTGLIGTGCLLRLVDPDLYWQRRRTRNATHEALGMFGVCGGQYGRALGHDLSRP